MLDNSDIRRLLSALESIAKSLEAIVAGKAVIKTVDVERGKVYATHLGQRLSGVLQVPLKEGEEHAKSDAVGYGPVDS